MTSSKPTQHSTKPARTTGTARAFTSARNRAIDDETFYNKILLAVEAGYTIIPDFPIEVFAIRREQSDESTTITFQGAISGRETGLGRAIDADSLPAGAGQYRNPLPAISANVRENRAPGAQERGEPRYHTTVTRRGFAADAIMFPKVAARSPIMKATSEAMKDKVFDQVGVCHPVIADVATAARRADTRARRAGDPLIIGQILRKKIGSKQKCVNFLIAWHLDLEEL